MTNETAQNVINDQEDAIADLRHKLLAMTDSRDLAVGQSLELVAAMRRIICFLEQNNDGYGAKDIASRAISEFQGK